MTAFSPDTEPAEPLTQSAKVVAAPSPGGQPKTLPAWLFALTVICSLALGLVLFVALPNLIAFHALKSRTDNAIVLNLVEGAVKLTIFVAYIAIIARRPDIRRLFEFHGAEHKVVFAAENARKLTPDGARPFDTPHPRCGTGFALLTVLVSVLCFSFLPVAVPSWQQVLMRFGLMPLVAGISYEIIKMTAHPRYGAFFLWIMTPGLWLQRLTTKQPDDAQLEVSCAAMRAVLEAEEKYLSSTRNNSAT